MFLFYVANKYLSTHCDKVIDYIKCIFLTSQLKTFQTIKNKNYRNSRVHNRFFREQYIMGSNLKDPSLQYYLIRPWSFTLPTIFIRFLYYFSYKISLFSLRRESLWSFGAIEWRDGPHFESRVPDVWHRNSLRF